MIPENQEGGKENRRISVNKRETVVLVHGLGKAHCCLLELAGRLPLFLPSPTGRVKKKVEPAPGADSNQMRP